MNVLFTCAGRRNYLVDYFRQALKGTGLILAADNCPTAAALQEADLAFQIPKIQDDNYLHTLLDICEKHKVRLLLTLNDLELPLLASAKQRFHDIGVFVAVSAPDVIETCFDKWRTFQFACKNGLKFPQTYLTLADTLENLNNGNLSMPLVLKPRWGSASIGITVVESLEELNFAYQLLGKQIMRSILAVSSSADQSRSILIQEYVEGNEYGVDVLNDFNGRYVTTHVKRKLSMRAGETDRAVTEKRTDLEGIGTRLGRVLGHIGNLDCDFVDSQNGLVLLELNPRFGGGYPFSHAAGANTPAAMLAWVGGSKIDPSWFQIRSGVISAKCDRIVLCSNTIVE